MESQRRELNTCKQFICKQQAIYYEFRSISCGAIIYLRCDCTHKMEI